MCDYLMTCLRYDLARCPKERSFRAYSIRYCSIPGSNPGRMVAVYFKGNEDMNVGW
jgi:hypothetical protein